MDMTASIPVRAGSRRLPYKNVAIFGGDTLLERKIKQLKEVSEVTRIVVSSDSDEFLQIAEVYGVETHKRSLRYSDDVSVPFGEVVKHICSHLDCETVLWACCTSPLVDPRIYRRAIRCYETGLTQGFDSLMSVKELKSYLWDADGPLNYELGLKHPISQNLPILHSLTNGVFIAPRVDMIRWRYFHGPNPYRFVLSKRESVDINDALDLAQARAWLWDAS